MKKTNETYIIEKQKEKVGPNNFDLIKLDIIKKIKNYFLEQELKDFFCEILKDFKIEVLSHESLYHHVLNYEKPIEEIEKIINPEFKKCVALLKKELKKIKKLVDNKNYIVEHYEMGVIYSIRFYGEKGSTIVFICENKDLDEYQIDLTSKEQKELQSLKDAQEFINDFKIYKLIDNKKGK